MKIEDFNGGWIKHSEEEIKQIFTLGHPKIAPFIQLAPIKALQTAYNFQNKDTPINNQGQDGDCTGEMSTGTTMIYENIVDGGYTELSVKYNYWFSRYILNGGVPTGDDGSTILAAFQAMQQYGMSPDTDWPQTAGLNVKPSQKAQTDAKNFSVVKYFTIPEDTTKDPTKNTKLLTMKQVLAANSHI